MTKHEGTGGLVTRNTVVSQLLYEMGDPQNYLGPDCTADFTSAKIEEDVGTDRVKVSGVKGSTADRHLQGLDLSYHERLQGTTGQLTDRRPGRGGQGEALRRDRVRPPGARRLSTFADDEKMVEFVGAGVTPRRDPRVERPAGGRAAPRREVRRQEEGRPLRLRDRAAGDQSGPPGVTGFAGGRPKATDIVGYWPALLDKSQVQTSVRVEES